MTVTDRSDENRLVDEMLTCWLTSGAASDQFSELLARAIHEFDTRHVLLTLTAVTATLLEFTGDLHPGGLDAVRSTITANITKEDTRVR